VEDVVNFLKAHAAPDYVNEVTEEPEGGFDTILDMAGGGNEKGGSGDALYDQAVALVAREGKASTSFVQRHLQIGYNRAARLIERMEKDGVIGPANHVGKREVLVSDHSGQQQ
jgi:S-DNA-T family DNA segregation ATPase FtsK/SpoIIIE